MSRRQTISNNLFKGLLNKTEDGTNTNTGIHFVVLFHFSSVISAIFSKCEINLPVAILFVLGGVIGGLYGTKISSKVPKDTIKQVFTIILIVIAIYIIIKSMSSWI